MRLSRPVWNLANHIEYYSKFQPTSFSLQSLIDFGRLKIDVFRKKRIAGVVFLARDGDNQRSYKFLREELLIRWSHMLKEMEYLPAK